MFSTASVPHIPFSDDIMTLNQRKMVKVVIGYVYKLEKNNGIMYCTDVMECTDVIYRCNGICTAHKIHSTVTGNSGYAFTHLMFMLQYHLAS